MSEQFKNFENKNFENMNKFEKKLPGKVYYVYSPDDDTVLIAMDVIISDNNIRWFDTIKERIMTIEKILSDNSSEFVFKRSQEEGGQIYTFVPLTLNIYKEKVKQYLVSPQDFENEEEMFKAFEETKKNAW
jgi:hypothetical protein